MAETLPADLIERLEAAATIVMSAGHGQVADVERRKEAEQYFLDLRNSTKVPLELCRLVLEQCSNEFVVFQCVTAVREACMREWAVMHSAQIEAVWQYLVTYAINHTTSAQFVLAEIFQSVAMIIKRGTFDTKSGNTDWLYATIDTLIESHNSLQQSLACQALLALCTEHCTSWRSADLGITWDFHFRAKRHFESVDLKRMLQLCTRVLSGLIESGTDVLDTQHTTLAHRFIRVAEVILSWSFGNRLLPKRLSFASEFAPCSTLRPPADWADVFLNEQFVHFFFLLHSRIRDNTSLAHNSLQCLIQLAALQGDLFKQTNTQPQGVVNKRDTYVTVFVRHLLEVFAGGARSHEVLSVCAMVSKLMSYHPLAVLARMPDQLCPRLIQFVLDCACSIAPTAVHDIIMEEDDDSSQESYEALVCLLEVWTVLCKNDIKVLHYSLSAQSQRVFDAVLHALLAAPIGTRPVAPEPSTSAAVDDELEADDRLKYADLLQGVGKVAENCPAHAIDVCTRLLVDKLQQLQHVMTSTDCALVQTWQEDMHWLLLVIGHCVCVGGADGGCAMNDAMSALSAQHTPNTTAQHTTALKQCTTLLLACVTQPENTLQHIHTLQHTAPCPVVSVESGLLAAGNTRVLSPQLAQTSFWLLRRMLCAFCVDSWHDAKQKKPDPLCEVFIVCGSDMARSVIDFSLQRCFDAFNQWRGERLVTADALTLLLALMDGSQRTEQVCASNILLPCIGRIELAHINAGCRQQLMRVLVLMGAAADDPSLRQQMWTQVMRPLADKFQVIVNTKSNSQHKDTLDLLDCFTGVALAVQLQSATVLYEFLCPVLEQCVTLLQSASQHQTVLDAVLTLFAAVTLKLPLFVDAQVVCAALYACITQLLSLYAATQLSKYSIPNNDALDEKACDLALVMDILANILSRDMIIESAFSALQGLCMMLPLMDEQLLMLPSLCAKFFNLLLYMIEMYPDKLLSMRPDLLATFIKCAQMGISSQFGTEVVRTSLELIEQVATYLSGHYPDSQITLDCAQLVKPVFVLCVEWSCELDVFTDAAHALWALICCHQETYWSMVADVVQKQSVVQPNAHAPLLAAFQLLLPPQTLPMTSTRPNKRMFRERMETFLNNIAGLLSLQLMHD